jgi:hypothetical protein
MSCWFLVGLCRQIYELEKTLQNKSSKMQTIPTDLAEKHGVGCPPEWLTIMPGKVNHYARKG